MKNRNILKINQPFHVLLKFSNESSCSHSTVMENWPHYFKVAGSRAAAAADTVRVSKDEKVLD
jgi:hypothetical protein